MADKLDLSLDDIITQQKKQQKPKPKASGNAGGGGGGGGAGGRGRSRGRARATERGGRARGRGGRTRSAPYAKPPRGDVDAAWSHDMFGQGDAYYVAAPERSSRPVALYTGGKLNVSNLGHDVIEEDMRELFSKFGKLKEAFIHFDRSGRSLGSATVNFTSRSAAVAAMKEYNGVLLDGKPMKIELVSADMGDAAAAPTRARVTGAVYHQFEPAAAVPTRQRSTGRGGRGSGRGRAVGRSSGGRRRGGSRGGRGGSSRSSAPVTAADLDADLDSYHGGASA